MISVLILLSIGSVWLSLIAIMLPIQAISLALSKFSDKFKGWNYSVWILQDVAVNVIHGGSHKVTVSSKIGWLSQQERTGAKGTEQFVNWLWIIFFGIDDHCQKAIEKEDDHRYNYIVMITSLLIYWGVWLVVLLT